MYEQSESRSYSSLTVTQVLGDTPNPGPLTPIPHRFVLQTSQGRLFNGDSKF